MNRLAQILRESFMSTSRFPRWWILALAQAFGLYFIGDLARRHGLRPLFVYWLICGVLIMIPATVLMWSEIEAVKSKRQNNRMPLKTFIGQCLTAGAVALCSVVLILAARFLYPDWLFLALISSTIAATATLAMLYAVLCGQPFFKAVILAGDTWNRKISLAAIVAFILILAQGVSFAFVHGVLRSVRMAQGFSDYNHSATIWILLLVLLFLTAFVGAFLNNFLVLLFLETINPKKDPEAEKEAIGRLITSEVSQ